ncbi:class I SAM-dependent methyltransferase [Gemmatimonas groenlandica]|uniref:Class I SAM-dependent methyltransferase n=1 Tax=Gemmatimonas groenlandica TaxID=2732249 RepID=A0A6M4IRL6_9BACT|nr:methyltransferase domain-containing protein [Gemmatimonas groenlandica]QJR36389.1 class I SAM-dependent methyltransferase [Gemmatimonas groenlandica]
MPGATRGPFDGVWNIVRFNWPTFTVTLLLVLVLLGGAVVVTAPVWRVVLAVAAAGLAAGTFVSLAVSHVIYDRSDLYRFAWLTRINGDRTPNAAVFCQTGFDESSALLRARTPNTHWTLLDHYDPARMTEPSIQRARRHCPPAHGTVAAPHNAWPTAPQQADLVIGMLAVHELRHCDERAAWFREAARTLRPGGRVVVVEHLRDMANLLAFGPGVLHFHSTSTWRRSWERAQLRVHSEFRITPWVAVVVLEHAA